MLIYVGVYIYFKGRLIRIMWRVLCRALGNTIGRFVAGALGAPVAPRWPPVGPEQSGCGLNTLRQCLRLGLCPSLRGRPSEQAVPRVRELQAGA